MPYISTKTNVAIKNETVLKEKLGKAISLIPGKSEAWLMLNFEDNCRLYFKGSDSPAVFSEVKIFGKATDKDYDALTAEITKILSEELNVSPDRIYIKYEEVDHWGWNGGNF